MSAAFLGGQAGAAAPPPKWAAAAQLFSHALKTEQTAKKIPALSAVLVAGRGGVWQGSAGHEDIAGKRPASADSAYRLGAVSELFVDVLVLQLAEQNKLDLDMPVRKYLPGFAAGTAGKTPVTLRQLMAHQVQSASTARVLAKVLEAVEGQPYEAIAKARIFGCAQMNHSGFRGAQLPRPIVDGQYTSYDGDPVTAPRGDVNQVAGEGAYSSAKDLGRFMDALLSGRGEAGKCQLLGAKALAVLWALPAWNDVTKPGIHRRDVGAAGSVSYGGAVYGHSAAVRFDPVRKIGVAVLGGSQATPVVAHLARYGEKLMQAAAKGAPLPDYIVPDLVPAAIKEKLAGYYQDGGEGLILRSLWDKLYLEAASVTAEVRQKNGAWYLDDVRHFSPDLVIDPEGRWVRLNGKTYQRAVWQKPKAPSAELAGLMGEYGTQKDFIRLYQWDGKAYARLDGRYYVPLTRIATDVYRLPEGNVYAGENLIFSTDASGQGVKVAFLGRAYARHDFGAEVQEKVRAGVRINDSLRTGALKAVPPKGEGGTKTPDLVELIKIDPRLKLDIRYATANNFIGTPVYPQARAFMERPAALALRRVDDWLRKRGYGLLIHDGYRPWYVTKIFWDATPQDSKIYVAYPPDGSRHNRGAAVDLTLFDLKSGKVITMPGRYDELWTRSWPQYIGGSDLERWHKDLLRRAMEENDFKIYPWEWWHFDFDGWQDYPIQNRDFPDIPAN
ncbi:serine hydrolase [Kordiimonas marina]|uniref:serine hydrolase n=1 Tax=Kordiimonas marina TaxID=2872312 RepID=UPI001FF5460E|nr:serine hydrolase [Kordiimonas marina]MCJ9427985.1 serine hydrolase [Kordiimonas marina]